ncbi:MAG: hypothetical protein F4030_12080, partial [Gammaproteobacteria bacterium]|nr:hypothetical protein [Gammaproteobacteria bacterium]
MNRTKTMDYDFYTSNDLIDRLCHTANEQEKQIIFLVGSALCFPDNPGGFGVPDVSGIIELISNEFDDPSEFRKQLGSKKNDGKTQYQEAFRFLHAKKGQSALNRVIRAAVWQSLDTALMPRSVSNVDPSTASPEICNALEEHLDCWRLPKAVSDIGQLLVNCEDTFGKTVITTNFDPLIEISIRNHGGSCFRTILHSDGELGKTHAQGTHILHLHGYWQGHDTLHMPQQLMQARPKLRKSLSRIIEDSTLVVIGFGGWDDIISQTFVELLSDSESNFDILWAFYESNPEILTKNNAQLLQILQPGFARGRVSLYRGIDCKQVLCTTHERLKKDYISSSETSDDPSEVKKTVEEITGIDGRSRELKIEIRLPIPNSSQVSPDHPLLIEPWVGREHELNVLQSLHVPVAFITGIGGQGKSALAGRLLKLSAMDKQDPYEEWDWRDCREENDRLRTQVIRLVERFSNGAVDGSQIDSKDFRVVVSVLFQVLGDRRALLVFDNVDQYIDLETLEPVKDLDILISEAFTKKHSSLFLFTCRPDIRVDESRSATIPLQGLGFDEISELLQTHNVSQDKEIVADLQKFTDGHALWINLILMQAKRSTKGLRHFLELAKMGGSTLPDTTRQIWQTLNDQQKEILRTMAELDRPEPETQLFSLLPRKNLNRLNRALKTLRSFHLVEIRPRDGDEPLMGLHPIIREFVRTNFPKPDRERYIGRILGFLESMISRFKGVLAEDPSYEILEHWTRKADLQITFGKHEEAMSTIAEVCSPLLRRGYSEEFVRQAIRLFEAMSWSEACVNYKKFDYVFDQCLEVLIEIGHDKVDMFLTRYEESISGKSAQYILLCSLRCYEDWYKGEFQSAISWGEAGEKLKKDTQIDTSFSSRHHLALSLRDAGREDEALKIFLGDLPLEEALSSELSDHEENAAFFGNIGRCLYLTNEKPQAIRFYIRSAKILETRREVTSRLNKGYIRYWIAQLLEDKGEAEKSAAVYRAAILMWQ